MRLARFRFLIMPVFFLLACVVGMAQQNSEIAGTVTDQTGAAVPDAQLTLKQQETGFTYNGVSNATGAFVFPGLNVGTYSLKVTAKGFQSYTATGLTLNVSQTLTTAVKLTVGAENVEISVTADALQVQAESNEVSTLISGEQVTEIATENRNFTALAALGVGVSSNLPSNNTPTASASSASISVNGLRQSHNIWLLDGAEADDRGGAGGMSVMPSMDAIAQFQVLASNYPPDYGIASGATFSLALKSGTQHFHGGAWEFLRNDALDANDFFNKYQKASPDDFTPVPKLRQNIFGFNIGGPVVIPGVYRPSTPKTFFFYNMEWRRIIQTSSPNTNNTIPDADRPTTGTDLAYIPPAYAPDQIIYVPDATQVPDPAYAAKLEAAGYTAADRGKPFRSNTVGGPQIIPASLFDPNAVLYLNSTLIPHSNTAGDKATTSEATPTTASEEVVRIDHQINDKWQLLGHYLHDSQATGTAFADLGWNWETYNTVTSVENNPANSAAIKLTGTISPSLLLEASMNYDGNVINITNSPNVLLPAGWTKNTFFDNSGSGQFNGVQYSGTNFGAALQTGYGTWHNAAQDYEPRVDLSYSRGKHAMKFGFSYNRYTKNQQLQADAAGDYSFGRGQSGNGLAASNAGDPFISQILGLASSYSQPQSMGINHYVNQTTSVWVNDNWKATPRLSLQLGFRYDALPHAWERNNNLANFDPSQYIAQPVTWSTAFAGSIDPGSNGVQTPPGFGGTSYYLNGMVVPGQNGVPHGVVTNDYNTAQPRVGFSYDLTGNGKTVLRGGFGTFYERIQGNDIYGVANSNLPFEYTPNAGSVYYSKPNCSWNSTADTDNAANCGSPSSLPIYPASLNSLATTYKAPGAAMYSFGVQRELKPSVILNVQYVGNLAWHQNIKRPINNFPINTDDFLRWGSVNGYLTASNGFPAGTNQLATYQGYGSIVQIENTTNNTYNGGQVSLRTQNHWGLSGELDYTYSHNIDLTDTDLSTASNPWNLKYDKAGSGYDRRHMFQGNYIYALPIFNKSHGLIHSLLGGWQLAGTFIWESGLPVASSFGGPVDTVALGNCGGNCYTNRMNVVNHIHYSHKVNDWFDTYANGGVSSLDEDPQAVPTPGYHQYTKQDDGTYTQDAGAVGPNLGFGNGRRDTFVGPGRTDFTTSLYKSFAFTEHSHFEFRAESYNTFNHTEYQNINSTWTPTQSATTQYGTVTSDWGPRVLQLGAKIVF